MEAGGREIGEVSRASGRPRVARWHRRAIGQAGGWVVDACVSCPSQVEHVMVNQVDGPNQGVNFAEFAEYFYVRASRPPTTAHSLLTVVDALAPALSATRVSRAHVRRI